MAEAKSVPVLFVTDTIVLPGMVVPIALDDAARAAIDAAQASESRAAADRPRLEDRYPSHGVVATIVQVGRIAGRRRPPPSCAVSGGRTSARGPPARGGAVGRGDRGRREPSPPTKPRPWRPSTRSCCWPCCSGARPGRSSTTSTSSPTRRRWRTPPAMRPT